MNSTPHAVLAFVQSEEICSRFELEQFVILLGSNAHDAAAMISHCVAIGLLEVVDGGDDASTALLRLSDAGSTVVQRHEAS